MASFTRRSWGVVLFVVTGALTRPSAAQEYVSVPGLRAVVAPPQAGTSVSDSTAPSPIRKPPAHPVLRRALAYSAIAGANVALYTVEKNRWWHPDSSTTRFHFHTDIGYARNFDKSGHFYGTNLQVLLIARALEWSGMRHARAVWLGAAIGLAMQTNVEITDGFYRKWGFDVLDQTANVLGAGWFVLHERSTLARKFDIRWSYWPNRIRPRTNSLVSEVINSFTNSYNGHAYWISARLYDLLPEDAAQRWPRFLMLSAGVHLAGWVSPELSREWEIPEAPGEVSYLLSLDVDWRRILTQRRGPGRFARDLLERVHLPAPAVRLYPRPRVFLMFTG